MAQALNITQAARSVSDVHMEGNAKAQFGDIFNLCGRSTSGFQPNLVLDWLSTVSFKSKHENVRADAALLSPEVVLGHGKFSGQWLVESETFGQWRERTLRKLWYIGMPGAGKTVLASVIIDHLQRLYSDLKPGNSPLVAYLYLSYTKSYSLSELIGSVIRQIVKSDGKLSEDISQLWNACSKGGQRPTENELKDLLRKVVDATPGVYLVIDALDEGQPDLRLRLLEMLPEHDKLSVLVTSRYLDEFQDASRGFTTSNVRANNADLDLFIESTFDKRHRLREWEKEDVDVRTKVKYHVKSKCQGMFLVAYLQMKLILDAGTLNLLYRSLDELPNSIAGIYHLTLERIKNLAENKRRIAIDALCWIVFCRRPLTMGELRHALATRPGHDEFSQHDLYLADDIVNYCSGLLNVAQDTSEVTLVHYSARNHFHEVLQKEVPGFEGKIVQTCITYLSFSNLVQACTGERAPMRGSTSSEHTEDHGAFNGPRDARTSRHSSQHMTAETGHDAVSLYRSRLRVTGEYPFVRYAAAYLRWHLQQLDDITSENLKSDVTEPLNRLLESDSRRHFLLGLMSDVGTPFFVEARRPIFDDDWPMSAPDSPQLLGYTDFTKEPDFYLSETSSTLDEEVDELDQPQLYEAGQKLELSVLMLQAKFDGAMDFNADETVGCPRSESAHGSFLAFLKADSYHDGASSSTEHDPVDTDSVGKGRSLFAEVAHTDLEDAAASEEGLLGVDGVASDDQSDNNPPSSLEFGAHLCDGEPAIESRLLTALQMAAYLGWAPTVAYHASISPDVNAKDSHGASALMIAAEEWQWSAIDVLLEHGARIDLLTIQGHTALLRCAQRGCDSAIVKLVSRAARCESPIKPPDQTDTLLQSTVAFVFSDLLAVWNLASEVVSSIVPQCGPVSESSYPNEEQDTEPRNMHANMQLLLAALSGDCETITELAHNGNIVFSATDKLFETTAFFLAVIFDHFDTLKEMVKCGMSVKRAGTSRESTLLHEATRRNNLGIVRYLIDQGADVDEENPQGLTAWAANLDRDHKEVLRLLVEHGKADPNARGIDGTSSLYIAAAGGWFENVKFYLEIGIDPSIRTACLWAPLHWAAANGHYTCVVALLEAGAEASPLSDTSKTPLDLVEGRDDRDDIQKVLRDRGALLSAEVYERMEVGDTLSDAWSGDALFDASRPSIPGSSSPQYLIDLIHEIKSTLADALESSDYDAHDLERVFHQTILWLGHVGGDPDVEQQVIIRKESQDLEVWLQREVTSARFSDKNEDL